ncbi:MAG: T9SS type A sorting domain-containing protein [Candidatus Azobacteroides sp.]|nr:T9SS type A sorting domain-containing protein [Candidatus Azobacteroides sp.]
MKKTLLSIAAVFAALSINAQAWDFSIAPSGFTAGAVDAGESAAKFTDNGTDGVSELTASTDNSWSMSKFTSYPGLGFAYRNSGGQDKVGFKFNPSNGYVQADGADVTIVVIDCEKDDLLTVVFSAKGSAAVTASELITGKPTSSLDNVYPNIIELEGEDQTAPAIASGEDAVQVKAVYKLTENGNAAFKAKTGYRIYSITKGATSSINNVEEELGAVVAVEVYSVTGAQVAKAASLEEAILADGVYVVKSIYENGKTSIAKIVK